jgi:hypothetical protein
MKYIKRDKSVITGKKNLEHLYTFKDFPIYMGSVSDMDTSKDIKADMSYSIDKDSGIIQLDKVIPEKYVYLFGGHNDGIGLLWKQHYEAFAKFLKQFNVKNVTEIGGGNGVIAKQYVESNPETTWTIIEPNTTFQGTANIKVLKKYFTGKTVIKKDTDAIVHSHVFEHIHDPVLFLKQISAQLEKGGKHIFTFPNLYKFLLYKQTNCLNFEHTIFLTEYFMDYILEKYGFRILKKKHFLEHSIFYATEKSDPHPDLQYDSKYKEYKRMFINYIDYHKDLVSKFNKIIDESNSNIYMFGAHIFSQYLLEFGLNRNNITGVLDNSLIKQGKRLYGTNLLVYSPEIIKNIKKPLVILRAGVFQEEIRNQLLNLNKNVIILE